MLTHAGQKTANLVGGAVKSLIHGAAVTVTKAVLGDSDEGSSTEGSSTDASTDAGTDSSESDAEMLERSSDE
jgi:hypothetical protein